MKRDLARELFRSFKDPTGLYRRKTERKMDRDERQSISDPLLIKSAIDELVKGREWESALAEGNLFSLWSEIVGDEIAEHSEPVTFFEGLFGESVIDGLGDSTQSSKTHNPREDHFGCNRRARR